MKNQLPKIILIIVILVGVFATVDLTRRFFDNSKSNTSKEIPQTALYHADSFNIETIENNNELSRQQKNNLIESYLYNRDIKNDLKNTGYLNNFNNKTVTASFVINNDGTIDYCKILKSSNDRKTDKNVLKAIKKLNPYKPLPAIFKGSPKYVEFTYANNWFVNFKSYPLNNPRIADELTAAANETKMVNNTNVSAPEKENKSLKTENKITHHSDLSKYMQYLTFVAKQNWKNPTPGQSNIVAFDVRVNKDGKITSYEYLKLSGSTVYNQKVKDTILNISPFQPFPDTLDSEALVFQFMFHGSHINVNHMASNRELPNKVDQSQKKCNTVGINDIKVTRTQSWMKIGQSGVVSGMSVQENWDPPLNQNSRVDIKFNVSPIGTVSIKEVTADSEEAKNAAIKAIKSAKYTPFSGIKPAEIKYSFFVEDSRF